MKSHISEHPEIYVLMHLKCHHKITYMHYTKMHGNREITAAFAHVKLLINTRVYRFSGPQALLIECSIREYFCW